jgi:hypothetical protein
VLRDVERTDLAGFGCAELCDVGEVCRASDMTCVTPDSAANCNPPCTDANACIGAACVPIKPLPPFRDTPMAHGLWPSMVILSDGSALIAYYDKVGHQLKLAQIAGPDLTTGTITLAVIDGLSTGDADDTGWYPSLAVGPTGDLHVAYMDATKSAVMYQNLSASLMSVVTETVESGLGATSEMFIGANPALVVDGAGTVRVAYQNATSGLLRYGKRSGGTWTTSTLLGGDMPYQGSFGFYTDQVLAPDHMTPIVSTYRYFLNGPMMKPDNGLQIVSPP